MLFCPYNIQAQDIRIKSHLNQRPPSSCSPCRFHKMIVNTAYMIVGDLRSGHYKTGWLNILVPCDYPTPHTQRHHTLHIAIGGKKNQQWKLTEHTSLLFDDNSIYLWQICLSICGMHLFVHWLCEVLWKTCLKFIIISIILETEPVI